MPSPSRTQPARPSASRQTMSGSVLPLVIVVLLLAAGGAAWFLLGHKAAPPARRSISELVTAVGANEAGALAELAGRNLPEDASGAALRLRIAAVLKPLLVRDSGKEVLALAMRAAVHHRCEGLALPTLALFRSWPALPEEIGDPDIPAALIALVDPAIPGQAEEAAKVLDGLAGLIDGATAGRGLATRTCTHLQAKALATSPGMDHLLASLQHAVPDKGAITALGAVATGVFERPDLTKQLGDDPTRWKAFFEEEDAGRARFAEISAWIAANGSADRIADGLPKLTEHAEFLTVAQATCDSWLSDPEWQGLLGHPRAEIEALTLRVKQALTSNRSARAGASIGEPKKD